MFLFDGTTLGAFYPVSLNVALSVHPVPALSTTEKGLPDGSPFVFFVR